MPSIESSTGPPRSSETATSSSVIAEAIQSASRCETSPESAVTRPPPPRRTVRSPFSSSSNWAGPRLETMISGSPLAMWSPYPRASLAHARASAGRTRSSRLRAQQVRVWVQEKVARPTRVQAGTQGSVQGRGDLRAGPVAGWGCSAWAARFFGQRDETGAASEPCPQKPPPGAEHPHPAPPARGSVEAEPHATSRLQASVPPRHAGAQRQAPAAVAQVAGAARGQVETPEARKLHKPRPRRPATSEHGSSSWSKAPAG